MCTPDSSIALRSAVDAVAGPRHEVAFRILDLLLVEPPGADGARLRVELARLRTELDAGDRT